MHHYKRPEKHYVKPGDTVVVKLGASECMLSMGLTGKFMPIEILAEDGYGQLRDPRTGYNFSMPNPLGWMDFYRDETGWYSYEVYETGVGHTVTHTNGRFYVYVENRQLYGVQSLRFEEMRDAALEMHGRDIPSAEVRFVENSRHLNNISWSRSVVIPLDTEIRSHPGRNGLGEYRDTYLDVPTHFNLFAGRYFRKEANA